MQSERLARNGADLDGGSRDVDLTGELHGPVFEPLADPDFFAQVRVNDEI